MKNILITGCSAGIGHALTVKFLNNNYHVFAVSRNIEPLLRLSNKNITIIKADISKDKDQESIINAVGDKEIYMINNAAYGSPIKFKNSTNNEIRKHFETNFFAPLNLVQNLANSNRITRVLNISSGAAEIPLQSLLSYCSSKAAMHHAINCLKLEYPQIKFANLRPGMVDTPLQERWRNMDDNDFPNNNFYKIAKQDNKLISVDMVANFVYWVMTLESDKFDKEDWNINDSMHHECWLIGKIH